MKKLSKAIDSAVGSIGNILVDHLQPSLQAAAFKLNELHSLAKCTRQLEPLGLQVPLYTTLHCICCDDQLVTTGHV